MSFVESFLIAARVLNVEAKSSASGGLLLNVGQPLFSRVFHFLCSVSELLLLLTRNWFRRQKQREKVLLDKET